MSVLLVAHLPLLLFHYMGLWQIEHYQFFPFALGIFVFLFRSRKGEPTTRRNLSSKVFVGLDLLLLAFGIIINSPLLVCCGAVCLCFAACCSFNDIEAKGTLGYLTLLPLMTVRLPLGMDTQLIQYLQRATTRVASNILNHLGYLHYRDGNVLNFPDRQFLVEEACSGVQSLFTVLFLAALIICGYRRKLVHSCLVLGSAVCFAGVMNVFRVVAISVAWEGYQFDLSTGWQHDAIGYCALIFASALVYFIDLFLSLMLSAVTSESGSGQSSSFQNPIIGLWNKVFQQPAARRTGKTPHVVNFVKPANVFGWTFNFVGNWFSSRDKKLVPVAIWFLLITPGSLAFVWWLESAPQADLVTTYEESLLQAAKDGDSEAKSVFLESLVRLRSDDPRYRFQLAMHLFDCEQPGRAIGQLERLTTPGRFDYAPARIWLARQALTDTPIIPLENEQIEGHLLLALELQPRNMEAKRLIGEVLLKKGHLKAAEDHFLDVVGQDPAFAFSLAKIQTQLQRSPDQVKFHLDVAIDFFQERLMKNPQLVPERIRLSESLVLANRLADAERVLLEGMTTKGGDTEELRNAFANYYVGLAKARLKESVLNRDLCAGMVKKALQLAPSNRNVLAQAITLNSLGANFEVASLQPAIDAIRLEEKPSQKDRMLIVQTLAACDQYAAAISELRPLTQEYPEMNIVLARLLQTNGQVDESQQVVSQLLVDFTPEGEFESLQSALEYVDVLNMAGRYAQSRKVLISAMQKESAMSDEDKARWNLVSGQTAVAHYDQSLTAGTFKTAKEALDVLDAAWVSGAVKLSVLKRLALLSCSESHFANEADVVLEELLVNANVSPDVYNMVGSQAIRSEQFDKAKTYLERAFRLTRGNPMVLNNLALALVRGNSPDHERALQLTRDALEILPDHPDVLSTRAEVFVAMSRWEDARGDLEESLQNRPDDTDSRRMLARVCDEMGETSLAENHRRRIHEIESIID